MTNTAIFSGPGGFRGQATSALAAAGFTVSDETHNQGLTDLPSGEMDASVGWIRLDGDDVDIDGALSCVSSLNWVLRAHYGAPLITAPLIADQEAEVEKRIADLVDRRLADHGITA